MQNIINLIVEVVIRMLLIVVTVYVIPKIMNYLEANKDSEKVRIARMLADITVKAIEQTCGTDNAKKKAWATERLKSLLISKNINLNDDLVDDLIESAVNMLPKTNN